MIIISVTHNIIILEYEYRLQILISMNNINIHYRFCYQCTIMILVTYNIINVEYEYRLQILISMSNINIIQCCLYQLSILFLVVLIIISIHLFVIGMYVLLHWSL